MREITGHYIFLSYLYNALWFSYIAAMLGFLYFLRAEQYSNTHIFFYSPTYSLSPNPDYDCI